MFFKKIALISNRTTIEFQFKQFDNIRFIVFSKFCFKETKRSHTKKKNKKRRKKLVNSFKKIFFHIKIFRNVFLFSISNKNETKFFFQRGNKKWTVRSQKNRNVDIPNIAIIGKLSLLYWKRFCFRFQIVHKLPFYSFNLFFGSKHNIIIVKTHSENFVLNFFLINMFWCFCHWSNNILIISIKLRIFLLVLIYFKT